MKIKRKQILLLICNWVTLRKREQLFIYSSPKKKKKKSQTWQIDIRHLRLQSMLPQSFQLLLITFIRFWEWHWQFNRITRIGSLLRDKSIGQKQLSIRFLAIWNENLKRWFNFNQSESHSFTYKAHRSLYEYNIQ